MGLSAWPTDSSDLSAPAIPSTFEVGGPSELAPDDSFEARLAAAGIPLPPRFEMGVPSQPSYTMPPSDPYYRSPSQAPTLAERVSSLEQYFHVFTRRIDGEMEMIRQRAHRVNEEMMIFRFARMTLGSRVDALEQDVPAIRASLASTDQHLRTLEDDLLAVRATLITQFPPPPAP